MLLSVFGCCIVLVGFALVGLGVVSFWLLVLFFFFFLFDSCVSSLVSVSSLLSFAVDVFLDDCGCFDDEASFVDVFVSMSGSVVSLSVFVSWSVLSLVSVSSLLALLAFAVFFFGDFVVCFEAGFIDVFVSMSVSVVCLSVFESWSVSCCVSEPVGFALFRRLSGTTFATDTSTVVLLILLVEIVISAHTQQTYTHERETERQRDSDSDRETERQRDRETPRERERERKRETENNGDKYTLRKVGTCDPGQRLPYRWPP